MSEMQPIKMPARVLQRIAQHNEMMAAIIETARATLDVPDGWQFDFRSGAFVPPPQPAVVPDKAAE